LGQVSSDQVEQASVADIVQNYFVENILFGDVTPEYTAVPANISLQ
jgi:hypothetical protein